MVPTTLCPECDGSGRDPRQSYTTFRVCPVCKGSGDVLKTASKKVEADR
jgi:DnaJ-class molecular chaperone